jgi:RimJ/RimL family protein N-acetyltransferase
VIEGAARRLEGRLVVLEPLTPEHEAGLYAAATSDPEVWRWMPIGPPADGAAFRRLLEHALAQADAGLEVPFTVLRAADAVPLGSTRYLAPTPEHRRLEIGWTWLGRSAWGTGANVEAKLLLLEHAFERLGARRVEFKTDALNERSRRALEALPARFEGVHRKHMLVRGGESRDSAWYSVLDDEWPAVKENLRRRLARHVQAGVQS